ncbi:Transcriptional regulator SNIP1, contains FHA domain [Handroanthus impetiginosus]|uniref:Transcriptional regulator SNIP1, contains FHA domain n=1 Tax=Handroanthus impetiginosus TaxID=429701 RepID=A0A2G9GX94_9LAMI|nr:Transcriptional regulator SNIP1, contains FHA domain [Handroanthus impetiginosus]
MGRSDSESPVRTRGSSHRRSPSRRERSPARHRSSNADRFSSRNRSPRRARSRSPASHSPVRDNPSSRAKSPKHRKSPSPRSPVRQKRLERIRSPPPVSPIKEKPSSRTRSPRRVKTRSSESRSPEKGKLSVRTNSSRSARSRSPESLSPSPRSKRLRRAKAERDPQKGSEREHERDHRRKGDRAINEEKDLDKDLPIEKRDRRSGREAADNGSKSKRGHSASPSDRHHRGQRRSRSPYAADNRGHDELANSRHPEQRNGDSDSIAKMKAAEETLEAKEKQKPSFELSGKLAAETNRVRGITLLFNEPADARKPDIRWRLYVFKGGEVLNEPLYVHRQSCYLFGRERRVADIPTDHPSCSKQHAVLQYRQVEEENPDGTMSKRVRPYVMDLGSTNGTFINDTQIEPQRYYELFEKDTIKFGNSSREYVLLHENSAG